MIWKRPLKRIHMLITFGVMMACNVISFLIGIPEPPEPISRRAFFVFQVLMSVQVWVILVVLINSVAKWGNREGRGKSSSDEKP
jgi:hypothetical protein